MTGSGRRDEATAGTGKKGVQLSVVLRSRHCIEAECRAIPANSPKKVVKAALGFLLTKVPECNIPHLYDKNKKVRSKGALPSDWSKGLKNYVHVKGGNMAMAKVKSRYRKDSFMAIISTPGGFNMRAT